jgi:hypothetical protein
VEAERNDRILEELERTERYISVAEEHVAQQLSERDVAAGGIDAA